MYLNLLLKYFYNYYENNLEDNPLFKKFCFIKTN